MLGDIVESLVGDRAKRGWRCIHVLRTVTACRDNDGAG